MLTEFRGHLTGSPKLEMVSEKSITILRVTLPIFTGAIHNKYHITVEILYTPAMHLSPVWEKMPHLLENEPPAFVVVGIAASETQ
jgi:hypothetical protein